MQRKFCCMQGVTLPALQAAGENVLGLARALSRSNATEDGGRDPGVSFLELFGGDLVMSLSTEGLIRRWAVSALAVGGAMAVLFRDFHGEQQKKRWDLQVSILMKKMVNVNS